MYNVTRLLISLTLFGMIGRVEQASKPYFCDQKDFNEIDGSQAKIRRLSIYGDVVYVVLDEKVIFFRSPRIHRITTRSSTRLSYLSSPPFFAENHFMTKGIGKLVGLQIDCTGPQVRVEEIFSSNSDGPVTDLRELEFSGAVPAIETGNSAFFASKETYRGYLVKYRNNHNTLAFRFEESSLTMNLTEKKDGNLVQREFELSYEVEKAVFFADNQTLDNALIELDTMQNIHVKEFDFKMLAKSLNSPPAEISIPLADLLNCHKPLTVFDQIKGIYFDERQEITYLFIGRFYVRTYENLIKSSFFIDYKKLKPYDENELDLEFDNEELNRITFENSPFVQWIKVERANAYLTTPGQVFRISVSSSDRIQLKRIEKPLLSKCLRQTLAVNGVLFCFRSKTYYRLTEANQTPQFFKIKDLFASAPFRHFDTDEKLEFIFNYNDDRVIFMTREHFFMLYYGFFSLDKDQNLVFNHRVLTKVISIRNNCLFSNGGGECKKSEIAGDYGKKSALFYVFALLPVIVIAFVVGLYVSIGQSGGLGLKGGESFSQTPVKQFTGKKPAVSPRNQSPGCSISRTDTYSQSRKSSKTLELDTVDRPAKLKKARQTSSTKPVPEIRIEYVDLNAHIKHPKGRRGINR